jgi:hypothetical protein
MPFFLGTPPTPVRAEPVEVPAPAEQVNKLNANQFAREPLNLQNPKGTP